MRKIIGIILFALLLVCCFVGCSLSERVDIEIVGRPQQTDTIIINPWEPQPDTSDYPLGH